jgi:hypothetical protein
VNRLRRKEDDGDSQVLNASKLNKLARKDAGKKASMWRKLQSCRAAEQCDSSSHGWVISDRASIAKI